MSGGLPGRFPVRVCMLSDWIVGTGEGRVGDVDATVRRDGDGLPFIPAKTLTGIWRDACEQVAGWLTTADGGPGGAWLDWVSWIFGSQPDVSSDAVRVRHWAPRPAALALSPARLPRAVRVACQGRPALLAAAVVLRPGVAIEDETGVAQDDMLRVEERARPETLEALADFTGLGAEVPRPAEFLLRAGAAVIDGLGGKRNRGAGSCWLLLPGIDLPGAGELVPATPRPPDERLAELAADMALLDAPGPVPERTRAHVDLAVPAGSSADAGASTGSGSAGTDRTTWRVTLEVLTPLVAQQRVISNVTLSRDHLPGSRLLPAILGRLDRPVGHGEIGVGDARPAIVTGDSVVPGLPAPMTWYRSKDRHSTEIVNAGVRRPGRADRLKPMRAGHVAPAREGVWFLLAPGMFVSTHAVIDDDQGRPGGTTDDGQGRPTDDRDDQGRPANDRGGVFSYLGIAPGTVLVSDMVLPGDVRLRLSPGDRLRLGRSRKDDFGEVEVRDVRAVTVPDAPAIAPGAQVRVWCVSDVLMRNEWGAFDPSPEALARELSPRLGAELTVVPAAQNAPVATASRAARHDSFHTRWGRPRPTLTGMCAGSVITLAADGAVTVGALAEVQRDGIGERTAEGFGQIRIDAPELTAREPTLVPPEQATAGSGDSAASGEALPAVPHVLEEAAVRAEIAQRVAYIVTNDMDSVIPGASGVRSRSQWGSLREQLPRLRTPDGEAAVVRWLDQTREVRQRRNAWGKETLGALRELLTDHAQVWVKLDLAGDKLDPYVLAPDRADGIRGRLWAFAVSALLTDVARHQARAAQSGTAQEVRS